MKISREILIAERLHRQRLAEPVRTDEEYEALFRLLQPVLPVASSCPGDPPCLVHRAAFDDKELTSSWREKRKIVKGRFLSGSIGYVFSDELELYANAFQRPIERLSHIQQLVYDALMHVGPLTPRQIKQETGLLNKEIMPVLHRLQQAFLVYEDQLDSDWERPFYAFSQEWPDVEVDPDRWQSAASEVAERFIRSQVFVTGEQLKCWSGWSVRETKLLLEHMQGAGQIVQCSIDGLGDGWMCAEDILESHQPTGTAFMLHKSDPLVRAAAGELKSRFSDLEVLQYLLIDGDFSGAVCGHWRIGPHDVDDIVLHLDSTEIAARKDEMIDAVAWQYHPPHHRILKYAGQDIVD